MRFYATSVSRTSSILLAAATCLVLTLLPATAGAEFFIPEGNSAVNQYTEGIPTGGGERDSKGAGEKEVRPAQAIGARNTEKLEQAGGREGREVAEAVAETAPPPVLVEETAAAEATPGDSAGSAGSAGKGAAKQSGKGKAKPAKADDGESEATAAPTPPPGDGPGGSGGFGEILSAATGGSAGGIGLLLPLVIVGAIAWGIGYAWRQRATHPTASTNP